MQYEMHNTQWNMDHGTSKCNNQCFISIISSYHVDKTHIVLLLVLFLILLLIIAHVTPIPNRLCTCRILIPTVRSATATTTTTIANTKDWSWTTWYGSVSWVAPHRRVRTPQVTREKAPPSNGTIRCGCRSGPRTSYPPSK